MTHNENSGLSSIQGGLFLLLSIFLDYFLIQYWPLHAPWLSIMVIWYWSLYQPEKFPIFMIFLFGFLQDFLFLGVPYGTHSFIFISGHLLVLNQSYFIGTQPFYIHWILLGFFLFLSLLLRLMISMLLTLSILPFIGMGWIWLSSFLIYPILYLIFLIWTSLFSHEED